MGENSDKAREPGYLVAPPLKVELIEGRIWLDDEAKHVGQKAFRLLCTLMQRPEKLWTKDELIEVLWDGRSVTDAVLTTAMKELRRALAEPARNPRFIETVHGRGYRFLLPVKAIPIQGAEQQGQQTLRTDAGAASTHETAIAPNFENSGGAPKPRPTPFAQMIVGIALLLALAVILLFNMRGPLESGEDEARIAAESGATAPGALGDMPLPSSELPSSASGRGYDFTQHQSSIAVLPFLDMSPAQDQTHFSDGLAEEILNRLVGIDGLGVTSRTSSFVYRDRTAKVSEIGQELGVNNVLEGSVRIAGDRVRVTAQLIEVASDTHLWSEIYERELSVENLFEIQENIAASIVTAMEGKLNVNFKSGGGDVGISAAGTQSLVAYDNYLRARELFVARRDLQESVRLAEAAVEADPNFARGWELLASVRFVAGGGNPSARDFEAVATALRLNPYLSLAHAIKGVMGNINPPYDWSATVQNLERAVALDSKNTTALLWLGVELRKLGYFDRAGEVLEDCIRIDPAYTRCRLHLLYTAHMMGNMDQAILEFDRLILDGAPTDDAILLLEFIDRGDDVRAEKVLASLPENNPFPRIVFEALRDQSVDKAAAENAFRDWLAGEDINQRDVYPIAMAFGAYDLLLLRQGSYFGLWLPEFPEFRESREFKDFVRTFEMDDYWREHGFPSQCRAIGADDFACD